jgi:hypothetical protein
VKISTIKKVKKPKEKKQVSQKKSIKNTREINEDDIWVKLGTIEEYMVPKYAIDGVKANDDNEVIHVENGTKLLILLISMIIESNKDFMNILVDWGITGNGVQVDDCFGKYSFEEEYKAYNIYDTGYYIEIRQDNISIFNSLKNIGKYMEAKKNIFWIHLTKKELDINV